MYTSNPLYRFVMNAGFIAQLWNLDISPLSDRPFWSLSYEAWFYILFGLCMARRWICLILATVMAGPSILCLMILWLIGVVIFDIFESANTSPEKKILVLGLSALVSVILLYVLLTKKSDVRAVYDVIQMKYLASVTTKHAGTDFIFVAPTVIFVPIFVSLLCAISLTTCVVKTPTTLIDISRRIGDFTFPMYLFHFPIFVFCGALGFYDRHSTIQKIGVFVGICCLIFLTAPLTTYFRNRLRHVMPRGLSRLEARALWFGRDAEREMASREPAVAHPQSDPG
jgi:peptidoglycan/LPS O-acetylase OafA/YrhL